MRKWQTFSPLEATALLQLCRDAGSLAQCKQVHQRIVQHGLQADQFVATKLTQSYADLDDAASADRLFRRLLRPNVFAWTAVLAHRSRSGAFGACVGAYRDMKRAGVAPDGYVFPSVLRACAQSGRAEVGAVVHKDVIARACEANVQVCNALIDMYGKCGDVESARRVFDEMGDRDLLSWNSVMSGYIWNGLHGSAVELLPAMRSEGLDPDIVTWNMVMDAYCQMGLFDEARNVLEQIEEPNTISWTTLISGYCRIGKHKTSLEVFWDMVNAGKVWPDIRTLSSALTSCRHLGALVIGKEIHAHGIKTESRSSFYSSAGAALLTMYANCGKIQEATSVFEQMDKSDFVTWNAMILGFVDLGYGNSAIECFIEMLNLGIAFDQITISTLLPVCDLTLGKQIHAYIQKNSSLSGVITWNALIHMYSKQGCIQSALSIFSNMETKDIISWNSIIGGFGMHGHGEAALQLLQEMKVSGFQPNSVTLTSALSACSHSGLVHEGLRLFNSMPSFGLTPAMEHFACVVDMLARAGQLEEAVELIRKMPSPPDKRIWGALLAACQAYHNVDVACLAAEALIHLEPDHAGHYVTLANIYAKAGRWDDAVRVRKVMEGQKLVKPFGYSWVEGEDQCHDGWSDRRSDLS
ncbi:hypothetical protein ACJRO7_011861 [Eucalyptus globulus]|uniref:Pentatricopeptide repeat-containing protein n=1 Tax=Eucalyptus globulus TaxID=34317 RepID=A0ABD3LL35_EUCGL